MDRRIARIAVALLWVALVGFVASPPFAVGAQEDQRLSIWPLRQEYEVNPGETAHGLVNVMNRGSASRTVRVMAWDFEAGGEEGYPQFADTPPESSVYSLASWIVVTKEPIVIAPGETVEVPFTINVPQNAEPGGYYAGILIGQFSPEALEGEGGAAVTIGSAVASLILLTVEGEIIEAGSIREFSTPKSLYEHLPVDFIVRFENTGNVHVKPQGNITIYDWSDNKVWELPINAEGGNVLPGSVREFTATWDEGGGYGKYEAVITLRYGSEDKTTAPHSLSFWVIPWKIMAAGAAGLLIFIVVLVLLIRRFRFTLERR